MPKKYPGWYSKNTNDPKVYHDNTECPELKKIKPENLVPGQDGRRLCEVCEQYDREGK